LNLNKLAMHFRSQKASLTIGVLVVPVIAFFLIRQIADFDMWFHLAMGKLILATGSLPTTDQLSLLNHGRPLVAHLWLFQLLTASGYQLLGFWWLHLLQIAAIGTTLLLVYRASRNHSSASGAWLLLLVVTVASSERFTVRPELVSFVMIAVYYVRLQYGKYYSAYDLAIFIILQAIWTNSHGIFVIGPFMAGCYLFESLLPGPARTKPIIRARGILCCSTVLACLPPPNGLSNLRYAFRLLTESNPLSLKISNSTYEMAPALGEVSRTLLPFWFYLFLIAAFLTCAVAAICCRRDKVSAARLLIGFFLLAASLTGMKNMPLFAIVAAPLIAENWSLLDSRRLRRSCSAFVAAIMLTAAFIWSPRPAFNYLTTWVPYRFGLGISGDFIPLGMTDFLDRTGFRGPIFNSMDQGGFYAYHGYPGRLPFYDSRLQDYSPEAVIAACSAAINAYRQPSAWYALNKRFGFRGILLGNLPDDREAAGLLPLISTDPDWRLVYLDHAASFWMRTDQGHGPPPVDHAAMVHLVDTISNASQAENMAFFLEKTGRQPELRRKLLEKASRQWENTGLLISLGQLAMQSGDFAAAEEIFLRVLRYKPDSRVTLTTLAQLALFRKDRAAAEKYLRKALHHYPRDAELQENLNMILNHTLQTDR